MQQVIHRFIQRRKVKAAEIFKIQVLYNFKVSRSLIFSVFHSREFPQSNRNIPNDHVCTNSIQQVSILKPVQMIDSICLWNLKIKNEVKKTQNKQK